MDATSCSPHIAAEPVEVGGVGRRRAPRGVTLIELMVATTIAGIVIAGAVSSVATIQRFVVEAGRSAELDGEAKLLVDYLVASSQGLGGGAIRPWVVVNVDDNWDAANMTDRVTIVEIDDSLGECTIESHPGHGAVFTFDASDCCIDSTWDGREVIATSPNGNFFMTLTVGTATSTPGNCQGNFPPGLTNLTGFDRLPGTDTDMVGGAIVLGKVSRFFLDSTRHVLVMEKDTDGDGVMEQIDLADSVYDFQAALGYDPDRNGIIVEDGTTADEWLFNAPADALGSGGLVTATGADLRMINYGVAMGVKTTLTANTVQILNGSPKTAPGIFLRGTHGAAMFRNLALFDL
jgi:prepilin-type N-terminal cleavage/methylation domain-containing protein